MLRTSCHSFGKLAHSFRVTLLPHLLAGCTDPTGCGTTTQQNHLLQELFLFCNLLLIAQAEKRRNVFFTTFLNSSGEGSLLLRLMPAEAEKLFTSFLRTKFYRRTTLVPFQVPLVQMLSHPFTGVFAELTLDKYFLSENVTKIHCLNKLRNIA